MSALSNAARSYSHRAAFAILLALWIAKPIAAQDRPNILWITAEDMSPTLGCWGDEYATTPHIDKLASESVRYTQAFATAPVCSPSRSCLITGVYATSLGTEQMRSAFPVPNYMHGFPALLREVGYYTSNNYKTDYNTSSGDRIIQSSWDESSIQAHWRNRPDKAQPFFSVFNIMTSHQSRSMVWTQERFRDEVQSKLSPGQIHDPEQAPIPPYYPNNTVTRRIVSRYYDCVTAMDQQVGRILQQLEGDGLAENTIVFFYSDHGSGMPRHKRLLHDSGMHVPLLIRFPAKYSSLAPKKAGDSIDRLVSFVDFPPTVLRLTGVDVPYYMQGQPFLGKDGDRREYVFGHRDRIDEVFDLSRSVRDKKYLYIRNYMPHHGWNQYSAYSDMSEIRHELYRIAEAKTMTLAQGHYAGPTKPAEELYDCEQDPQNLINLAQSPAHVQTLNRLRAASLQHIQQTKDLGFIPESLAWKHFRNTTPFDRAQTSFDDASLAAWAADSLLYHDEQHAIALANEANSVTRYWGVLGLANYEDLSQAAKQALRVRLQDASWAVRIEAAAVLVKQGDAQSALPVLIAGLEHSDLTIVLHATRTVELLGESARAAIPAMRKVAERVDQLQASDTPAIFAQSGEKDLAMFCSFSAHGFLTRVTTGAWINLLQTDSDRWTNMTAGVRFSKPDQEVAIDSDGKNLWLMHPTEFRNFELTAEVLMPEDEYNAGIAFRCEVLQNGRPRGYQCEIADAKTGMLYAIGSGGWVWPRDDDQRQEFTKRVGTPFRPGKWNHIRIRCVDDEIQIRINGILATDTVDRRHKSGRIGLQHHGKGGTHRYRNVRVRTIDSAIH